MKKPGAVGQIIGHLWMLPLTLLGLLMVVVYSFSIKAPYFQLPGIRWRDGRLEVVPLWIAFDPGAQTFGNVVFFCHVNAREDRSLVVHECVHIVQAMRGSVFYALAYIGLFVKYLVFAEPLWPDKDESCWYRAYRSITFERTAYRRQLLFQQGRLPGVWGCV